MTLNERAERFRKLFQDEFVLPDYMISRIFAELQAACDKARIEQMNVDIAYKNKCVKEAYLDAAEMAEEETDTGTEDYCGDRIAEKLRAKASEVGK